MARASTSSGEPVRDFCREILKQEALLRQGGGKAGLERQRKLGRLPARERIGQLLDKDAQFFEIGLWAAYKMYEEWGNIVAAGAIAGIGNVSGVPCMLIANDAAVKAGAFFPATVKKRLRAQRIAFECSLPIIYLVDSAGVFLPMQDEIFSGRGRFWPDLSKQLSHFRGRNSAVRRHRGKLRCGRRLPACTLRQDFDDRGERALSRRSVAGQSRDWSGGRTRRTRRREDAFGNQRHRRFLREDRRIMFETLALARCS